MKIFICGNSMLERLGNKSMQLKTPLSPYMKDYKYWLENQVL